MAVNPYERIDFPDDASEQGSSDVSANLSRDAWQELRAAEKDKTGQGARPGGAADRIDLGQADIYSAFQTSEAAHLPAPGPAGRLIDQTGAKVTRDSDGSWVTEFMSGDKKIIRPDWTEIWSCENGDRALKKPDGTTVLESHEGWKETRRPDGTYIREEADGRRLVKGPDGTVRQEVGGITTINRPDGTVITIHPDGSRQVLAPQS